jgi:hypothetical protein
MGSLLGPTGSLTNNIFANARQNVPPAVGMGATELCYTDRHAYTIVEVVSPKEIVVQQDTAIRTDKNGMSESQDYRFEANPNAKRVTVTLRKNGRWVVKGESAKNGTCYAVGGRSEYHDYSF